MIFCRQASGPPSRASVADSTLAQASLDTSTCTTSFDTACVAAVADSALLTPAPTDTTRGIVTLPQTVLPLCQPSPPRRRRRRAAMHGTRGARLGGVHSRGARGGLHA